MYSKKWLDFGVMIIFCVFNFAVVFFCSWLYLGGLKSIRARFSPAARRQNKASAESRREKV